MGKTNENMIQLGHLFTKTYISQTLS